jgi:hypothetical protein
LEENGEGESITEGIAVTLSETIQNNALPLKRIPLTLLLMFISAQGYLTKALCADLVAVLAAILLGIALKRILKRYSRYFYWYSGLTLMLALAGSALVIWQLQNWVFPFTLREHSEVLAIYLDTVLRLFCTALLAFMAFYLLAGTILLLVYCRRRYHRKYRTHHELSRF